MRKFLPVFLGVVLLVLIPSASLAHHRSEVLAEATPSSELVFPPVTSGTGFILPDSPLFFLDRTFQEVKLLLAFSPEQKVRVRAQIAGERLAELRLMLVRQSRTGINTALAELTKESSLAASSLTEAEASGKDVGALASELNEVIKTQRKVLSAVENQSGGTLRLQLRAARMALRESKIEVEDKLSDEELQREIQEGLAEEIEDEVRFASESARNVEFAIQKLEKEASLSSARALVAREEAIRKAIETRNEALQEAEEELLEAEKARQEGLLEAQQEANDRAREAVVRAQEAATGLKVAADAVSEIRNTPVTSGE